MTWMLLALGLMQCEIMVLFGVTCGLLFASNEDRRKREELEHTRLERDRLLAEQMAEVSELVDKAMGAVAEFREKQRQRDSAVPVRSQSSRHH